MSGPLAGREIIDLTLDDDSDSGPARTTVAAPAPTRLPNGGGPPLKKARITVNDTRASPPSSSTKTTASPAPAVPPGAPAVGAGPQLPATSSPAVADALKKCIEESVVPRIQTVLDSLKLDGRLDTARLGMDVLRTMVHDESFVKEVTMGRGTISPAYDSFLVARARSQVVKVAGLPKYQLQRRPANDTRGTVTSTQSSAQASSLPSTPTPITHSVPSPAPIPKGVISGQSSQSNLTFPPPLSTTPSKPSSTSATQYVPCVVATTSGPPPRRTRIPPPLVPTFNLRPASTTSSTGPPQVPRPPITHTPPIHPPIPRLQSGPVSKSAPPAPWQSTTPIPLPNIPGISRTHHAKAESPSEEEILSDEGDTTEDEFLSLPELPSSSGPSRASSASPAGTPPRKVAKRKANRTSPQNFRLRAHVKVRAQAWRGQTPRLPNSQDLSSKSASDLYYGLPHHPYWSVDERDKALLGARKLLKVDDGELGSRRVVHVDFSLHETVQVKQAAVRVLGLRDKRTGNAPVSDRAFGRALKQKITGIDPSLLQSFVKMIREEGQLRYRMDSDIINYLHDLTERPPAQEPCFLTVEKDDLDKNGDFMRSAGLPSLLLAREVAGHGDLNRLRRQQNFSNEFRKYREDGLELRSEWTNCAGDVWCTSWVSNGAFICGTTAHSDSHNQQYNRPGNLLLGSVARETLRAYADHRIVRPRISKGQNSTEAMRQTQDPWLYSCVASSDYDPIHDRAFTSSLDHTVKIWKVDKAGSGMSLMGTWGHSGNVNFVVASKHDSGMVATAADVSSGAVRVYQVNEDKVSSSSYQTYSCSRVTDLEGNPVATDNWAYFPATIQWGLEKSVRNLLLVGYSPRSTTTDDNDIPEDRRNTGEICLWDCLTGKRFKVTTATAANVFEVAWHPTQPCFIIATSPFGQTIEDGVRTQIRIFRPSDNPELGPAFSEVKVLDCPAVDINELTIMPNSFTFCYVTAACTDGKTYVWDTARTEKPIHILPHGYPVEEIGDDRERDDSGVQFSAWGTSLDRFYTGSSDGVVKVWNIRSLGNPLVRDLLEVPAPVTCGSFSPDFSRLIVGDASGRVFLLSVQDENEDRPPPAGQFLSMQVPGGSRVVLRPKPFIPHPEPPPPPLLTLDGNETANPEAETGVSRARHYLERDQLIVNRNRTVGAVQGPNYAEIDLFRREAHLNEDPAMPLLAAFDVKQQEQLKMHPASRREQFLMARPVFPHRTDDGSKDSGKDGSGSGPEDKITQLHRRNLALDLDPARLDPDTVLELSLAGVCIEEEPDYDFSYQEEPPDL